MKLIEIDAAHWQSAADVYPDLLAALGSPDWHGHNLNAVIDSMIYGGINAVEPPYRITFTGLPDAREAARSEFYVVAGYLAEEGAFVHLHAGSVSIEVAITDSGEGDPRP